MGSCATIWVRDGRGGRKGWANLRNRAPKTEPGRQKGPTRPAKQHRQRWTAKRGHGARRKSLPVRGMRRRAQIATDRPGRSGTGALIRSKALRGLRTKTQALQRRIRLARRKVGCATDRNKRWKTPLEQHRKDGRSVTGVLENPADPGEDPLPSFWVKMNAQGLAGQPEPPPTTAPLGAWGSPQWNPARLDTRWLEAATLDKKPPAWQESDLV